MSFEEGFSGSTRNESFIRHLARFIGETVIVFTTSGGESGEGFTGTLLAVNCDFIRLVIEKGSAPTIPFEDDDDDDDDWGRDDNNGYNEGSSYGNNGSCRNNNDERRRHRHCCTRTGAVADIPIDKIAAFVHNAE